MSKVTNLAGPAYSIKYYREDYYKVIRFNGVRLPRFPGERREGDAGDLEKLSQSISRAKSVIFQLALCNEWEHFFTCTLDPAKHDRYDLDTFRKKFPQWVRDYNKKFRCKVQYMLVPERHKDGAWHIHGFLRGIPSDHITKFQEGHHPHKLVEGAYLNWGRCSRKFGYCSLAPIRDAVAAAHYVTKYVMEDMAQAAVGFGCHMYYASIGLNRAVSLGYVYDRHIELDKYIDFDCRYCSTGICRDQDWVFFSQFVEPSENWDLSAHYVEVLTNVDFEQLDIAGWCSGNIGLSSGLAAGSIPAPAPIT